MPKVKEKFFIVKSLTVEDLELSVRNGIWATQAHNETALNKAYEVGQCNTLFHSMLTTIVCRERLSGVFSEQIRRVLRLRQNGLSNR